MTLGDADTTNPRNPKLVEFADAVVGRWSMTLENAWFLDPGTIQHGECVFEWDGDSFIRMKGEMEGDPTWNFVFGRSDANDAWVALYHDPRGTMRVFDMTFDGRDWTLLREDPDMHQRWLLTINGDTITSHPDVLEENGEWRKDFDVTFRRMPF